MFLIDIKNENREMLNAFLKHNNGVYIQQSYEWTNFQKGLNSRVEASQFCTAEENNVNSSVLSCSYTIIRTVFGRTYMHINRGPVFEEDKLTREVISLFFEKINEIARKYKSIYIRFDFPFVEENELTKAIYEQTKKAHYSFQPRRTLMIDLGQNEEEILSQMKSKGRYNIRLAKKKGVEVLKSTNIDDVKIFYDILKDTCSRDKFSIQPLSFYQDMVTNLGKSRCKIYLAKYDNKIIAANIVTSFSNISTYYYGSSSNDYRNLMAPYLLQWEAMIDAKKEGFKYYDFLGISETDDKKDSWAGITDFKRKFGGKEVLYLKSRELVINPFLYWLILILKKVFR